MPSTLEELEASYKHDESVTWRILFDSTDTDQQDKFPSSIVSSIDSALVPRFPRSNVSSIDPAILSMAAPPPCHSTDTRHESDALQVIHFTSSPALPSTESNLRNSNAHTLLKSVNMLGWTVQEDTRRPERRSERTSRWKARDIPVPPINELEPTQRVDLHRAISTSESTALMKAFSPARVNFAPAPVLIRPSSMSTFSSEHTKGNDDPPEKAPKTLRFWIIFVSLMAVSMLTAIDLTIISTSLPTIVKDIPQSSISASWITSSFLLTTTAFQPLMGGLADVMGRRNSLVVAVVLFLSGSVIAAMANSMLVLVIGRAVQGVGGGGIQAITEIIVSDLTTLKERGAYVGLIGLVFAVASLVSPVLGGVFSEHNWRWIFWINLPIGGVALALIIPCMKLKTPPMAFSKKIQRMDLFANSFLFAGMVGLLVGITEGGINYPWSNWRVLTAICGGMTALTIFFVLELVPNRMAKDPVLPLRLFSNRTSAACFLMTFLHGIVSFGEIYILPIYFQSIKDASPLQSAIDIFPATAPGPIAAIAAGLIMAKTGKYRVQISFWWIITTLGCGLLYLLDLDTPKWQWALYQVITDLGVGALVTITLPPIQSSLPMEDMAYATAAYAFSRSFGSVWGIALGTNVFIGTVNGRLNAIEGLNEIGLNGATSLGFATELTKLPETLIQPVKVAFKHALKNSFLAFIPFAILAFLISLFVIDLPLPDFDRSEEEVHRLPIEDKEEVEKIEPWSALEKGTIRISYV